MVIQFFPIHSEYYVKRWNIYQEVRHETEKEISSTISSSYFPEPDINPGMDSNNSLTKSPPIGILSWIVELGRVEIMVEPSLMASCMEMLLCGHLERLFRIFSFVRNKHNTEMVLDPSDPEIYQTYFEQEEWYNTVYGDCSEDISPNASKCRGFGLNIQAYVDSDHANDSITRRSRTGFIVFLNIKPI